MVRHTAFLDDDEAPDVLDVPLTMYLQAVTTDDCKAERDGAITNELDGP